MLHVIVSVLVAVLPGADDVARHDAQLLVHTIEALQQPIEDFQCEYEGTRRVKAKQADQLKVAEDAVADSYSGLFIWRRSGDTHIESLHRLQPDDTIVRETIVVRMGQQQAERYVRLNDAPLGLTLIRKPKDVPTWISSVGTMFMIGQLRQQVADTDLDPSVTADELDGQPLKVLNFALTGVPNSLLARYWVDLSRNGQVVQLESYGGGGKLSRKLVVKLAAFKVGNAEVWMPVSAEDVGYAALVDGKPVVMKVPQAVEKLYVVDGTLEFNKHPRDEVFTIKYKPGTPVSDSLRKLQYEFGQQKIGANPTKAEAESMLKEQLAKADEQKSELVVASASEGFAWSTWLAWGFGALVVISLIALTIQRQRH